MVSPQSPSPQLLCSTGAFSRDPGLTEERFILEYGPGLPADGLEVIFYSDWFDRMPRIAETLTASGLRFPVMHAEKSIGPLLGTGTTEDRDLALRRLVDNCWLARALGCELLVLHLWGLPGADTHIERNLAALPLCLDVAREFSRGLAIETIPCTQSDPLAVIRQVIARDDRALVALDTEFLALHHQLDDALAADWLWAGKRVRHVHIKDYDGAMVSPDGRRRYLHPGEGAIDFPAAFAGLARRGFTGTISLEASTVQPDGTLDITTTKHALEHIRALMHVISAH